MLYFYDRVNVRGMHAAAVVFNHATRLLSIIVIKPVDTDFSRSSIETSVEQTVRSK